MRFDAGRSPTYGGKVGSGSGDCSNFADFFLQQRTIVRRVLISGASGLVGVALSQHLTNAGYSVSKLVRPGTPLRQGDVLWDPNSATADVPGMEGFDAVVNLNGASIAGKRWTKARKAELRVSRLGATRLLVDCLRKLQKKPAVLVSSSGAGYYGDRGDDILTEDSGPGSDFLATMARDWEAEAARAKTGAGIRTVRLRFGVVFSAGGGALDQMARPFHLGVGGRLGSGKQWMPWVALDDVLRIVQMMIEEEKWRGPVNVVGPQPIRNEEFTQTMARILNRPVLLPAPAFALQLMLGELAKVLLLSSQHVVPKKLIDGGYEFLHPDAESALKKAFLGE